MTRRLRPVLTGSPQIVVRPRSWSPRLFPFSIFPSLSFILAVGPSSSHPRLPSSAGLHSSSARATSLLSKKNAAAAQHQRDALHDSLTGVSISRAYPDGCTPFPPSYSDYGSYSAPPSLLRDADDFLITRRLGSGKFSDVLEAIDVATGDRVVLKCLKPVSERKVRREMLVLSHLSPPRDDGRDGGCESGVGDADDIERGLRPVVHPLPRPLINLASIVGAVVRTSERGTTSHTLVLRHAGRKARWFCHGAGREIASPEEENGDDASLPENSPHLSLWEIKYFLYQLLGALDCLHSRGIMHRDVKPRNVLIDRGRSSRIPRRDGPGTVPARRRSLTLIDVGLADFYHPARAYNVRVASRHYKAPELLVGMTAYDYSVDLWAAGCILAGLLFRREPFFRGRDNVDQLAKVAGILGTEDLAAYCRKYGVVLRPDVRGAVFGTSSDSDTESEGGRDEAKGTTKMAAMERNVPRKRKRPWRDIPPPADAPPIPPEGIDLVDRLLRYDHAERPTAVEAMAHPFFDEVRETIEREWAEENAAREEKEVTSPSNFLQ